MGPGGRKVTRMTKASEAKLSQSYLDGAALLKLQTWLSPAFPVGAFTYSQGLEWVIETGDVTTAESLLCWLQESLANGAGKQDAALFAHAYDANDNETALTDLCDLAAALSPTEERLLETEAQGAAFIKAVRAGWPELALPKVFASASYPIAVGATAKAAGIDLVPALTCYLHAICANIVSAGVRLIPLGQSDGIRVLAALEPEIVKMAHMAPDTLTLGAFAPLADIASMKHETQYTRLFRS